MVANDWSGDSEAKPAPEPLVLIQALVNTVELPDGQDRLADLDDAHAWLVAHELLAPTARLTAADLRLARAYGKACALCSSTMPVVRGRPLLLAPLRDVAAAAQVRAGLDGDGAVRLAAPGDSVKERMVGLLLIIRDAQRDGSWSRLKACANDECRWAFYDRSRNYGGTWCDMATCGNKLKNREFRARRRGAASR